MKLITFSLGGSLPSPGFLLGDSVVGLADLWRRSGAGGAAPKSVLELLQRGKSGLDAARRCHAHAEAKPNNIHVLSAEAVTFHAPVTRPGKILCVGLNYRAHIEEMGRELPEHPVIFGKMVTALNGHRGVIPYPEVSESLDFEAELAVFIGKPAKHVAKAEAMDYVAGYAPFNDVTVRDYQRRTLQWLQGKNFDGHGPCGPALVTKDEAGDVAGLTMELRLNGETMQSTKLDDFIFDIPTLIAFLSSIMTLEPGDMIATGTPSGVGFGREPKVFMKPGDSVEVDIGPLGTLQNTVAKV